MFLLAVVVVFVIVGAHVLSQTLSLLGVILCVCLLKIFFYVIFFAGRQAGMDFFKKQLFYGIFWDTHTQEQKTEQHRMAGASFTLGFLVL